ncbi:MAG: hypothetical protein M3Y27_11180 [Acidobacteriota bacterium]|nr:hypothetical protein [Acidobacteriota bacterium]
MARPLFGWTAISTLCEQVRGTIQPEIGTLVASPSKGGVALGHHQLRACVIMANHVHVLLLPLIPARLSAYGSPACVFDLFN